MQERPIDLLDVDPAVLYSLNAIGDLEELARGDLRIRKWSICLELHAATGP